MNILFDRDEITKVIRKEMTKKGIDNIIGTNYIIEYQLDKECTGEFMGINLGEREKEKPAREQFDA